MRYYIEFKKTGNIKYISHLDMQRLFKRAFKRADIPIEYSQGYNPHPKMGFAQPLSLGYTASQEYIEFFTTDSINTEAALSAFKDTMPKGIEIVCLKEMNTEVKSLASLVIGAVYSIELPISYILRKDDIEALING